MRKTLTTTRFMIQEAAPAPVACHLSTVHRWFDERILHKECKTLARSGWDVRFIVPADEAKELDAVKILPLRPYRTKLGRRTLGLLEIVAKALRQKADVYHFHDPELIPVGLLLSMLGQIVIYDAHEDYQQKFAGRGGGSRTVRLASDVWWRIERISASSFSHVITADTHTKAKFGEKSATSCANFPPTKFTAVTRRREPGVIRVIYVGQMRPDRGLLQMAQALGYLRDLDVEFHIVGSTPDAELIRHLQSYQRVVLRGRIPWEELNQHLADADIGVVLLQPVPGYTYCPGENIVKLWEYMAVGLPVVISDFPKLRTLMAELGCGMTVDPTDPKAIAGATRCLVRDRDMRDRMGKKGRQAVLSRCNWEVEGAKLLHVYSSLLRQKLQNR
ncbi:MAG: glycosyltransferase family 4 protein [Verrucomicrobiia bacterium]